MEINCFLAMTAAEIRSCSPLPPKIAWMACHFSPYGTGLTNLPPPLPPGSMLIVNDRTPISGHDPSRILDQLGQLLSRQSWEGVLLDFQRPGIDETVALAQTLISGLPCPVGVSEAYCGDFSCPVFLPPIAPNVLPEERLAPWKGRDIWLEAGTEALTCLLNEQGAVFSQSIGSPPPSEGFPAPRLYCHHTIKLMENQVIFTLYRTPGDTAALLRRAAAFGVTRAIGLYQQLPFPADSHGPC